MIVFVEIIEITYSCRMSLVDDPAFTTPIQSGLLRSAIITEAVTNFLERFNVGSYKSYLMHLDD